jgi:hypothetical protein
VRVAVNDDGIDGDVVDDGDDGNDDGDDDDDGWEDIADVSSKGGNSVAGASKGGNSVAGASKGENSVAGATNTSTTSPAAVGAWQEELFAVGRLLALAITEATPLDICLSRCFYKVLLGEKITVRICPLTMNMHTQPPLAPAKPHARSLACHTTMPLPQPNPTPEHW